MVQLVILGSLLKEAYKINKSIELDEKAMKKYGKAFEKEKSAQVRLEKKLEYADKRLLNVASKKKIIINYTLPEFIEVYKVIQKIERENKEDIAKLIRLSDFEKADRFALVPVAAPKGFSDTQLVCGTIFYGMGQMMIKDSEQKLSAARSSMSAANVYEAQADSAITIYDAIIERANIIADMLVKLNILFKKSIEQTRKVIEKNGKNIHDYNEFDTSILMVCVNIAAAMTEFIDIPVIDERGSLCKSAVELIQKGQQYIEKMNTII